MKKGGELADRMMNMYQSGPIQVSTLRKNYVGKKARRGFLEMVRKSSRLISNGESVASSPKTWNIQTRTKNAHSSDQALEALRIAQSKASNNKRPITSRTCVISSMLNDSMIPEASMVIKKKRTPRLLCLAFKGLNDRRLNCVTSAIDQMTRLPGSDMMMSSSSSSDYVETIDISHNRLTAIGTCALIRKIGNSVRSLDLSSNSISGPSISKELNRLMESEDMILEELNLSSNDITDQGGIVLARGLRLSKHLVRLNLSNCGLKQDAGHAIASALEQMGTVIELDMSWNDFSNSLSKFLSITSLRHLRASHVSLRILPDDIIKSISKSIEKNKTLLHLDLSGCGISDNDMEILGLSLKQNQSLIGIHLGGNCSTHRIDARGFVFCEDVTSAVTTNWWESLSSSVLSLHVSGERGGRGTNGKTSWLQLPPVMSRHKEQSEKEVTSHDSCWICGGWRETSFLCFLPPIPQNGDAKLCVRRNGIVRVFFHGRSNDQIILFTLYKQLLLHRIISRHLNHSNSLLPRAGTL